MPKQISNNERKWHLIDLKGQILGRAATEAAGMLTGKNKVIFARNYDNGDYVVAINAKDIVVTGRKAEQKRYYHHTGYIGNMKTVLYKDMLKNTPEKIIINAVSGMLPKNKLRPEMLKRFKVYTEATHPHQNVKFEE